MQFARRGRERHKIQDKHIHTRDYGNSIGNCHQEWPLHLCHFLLVCPYNEEHRQEADHGRNPDVQEQEKEFDAGSYCGLDRGVNRRAQPHVTAGEAQREASLIRKVSNADQVPYRVEPAVISVRYLCLYILLYIYFIIYMSTYTFCATSVHRYSLR